MSERPYDNMSQADQRKLDKWIAVLDKIGALEIEHTHFDDRDSDTDCPACEVAEARA